jgi:hypothetical protein
MAMEKRGGIIFKWNVRILINLVVIVRRGSIVLGCITKDGRNNNETFIFDMPFI